MNKMATEPKKVELKQSLNASSKTPSLMSVKNKIASQSRKVEIK